MKHASEKSPYWRYTEPAPLNTKLLLLTCQNQCVVGVWTGPTLPLPAPEPGQRPAGRYKAWAKLIDRDHELERQLGWL